MTEVKGTNAQDPVSGYCNARDTREPSDKTEPKCSVSDFQDHGFVLKVIGNYIASAFVANAVRLRM